MNIFVLGRSKSGKTPFTESLCQQLNFQHIGASSWVLRHFQDNAMDAKSMIEAMTQFSIENLRANPFSCVNDIRKNYDLSKPSVIEGIRNPFDFIHLFDPTKDLVIMIERVDNPMSTTHFEKGLDVIENYLHWLVETTLMGSDKILKLSFVRHPDPGSSCKDLDAYIPDAIAFIKNHL